MNHETTHPSLAQRLQRFAPARVTTPGGEAEFRKSGPDAQGVTHVLLHGIGSGSGSWLMQLEAASGTEGARVLAWEAPGYGQSSPVSAAQPDAGDYASRLWALLDKLGITQSVTLVGHSLGALMAARAALQRPGQVERLVLLAPAQGYARASEEDRAKKLNDRLANLNTLGVAGMAQKRGAAMLSPNADAAHVAYVQSIMASVHPAGYTQASHLLAGGDLLADIAQLDCPISVASGRADTITPMAGCQVVAAAANTPWIDLGDAGHACALDAAAGVNELLGLLNQSEKATP
ncbi:MAG: alpha/beta fold hydrolase [Pseudomonadota bacterium]